ncbi:MAG: hypothetical protein NC311_16050 [Muribaculaceae bacterium]|nr:hypothetical protein [Muribaculaceae bacterium]
MREISVDGISKDEFEKISKIFNALNAVGTLQTENYTLTFDDVEMLYNKYLQLATNIKGKDKQAGAPFVNVIEGCLISALKCEALDISKIRSADDEKKDAELEAKKREETPKTWRNWWWLFKLQRNRAQELVDEEAALNADYLHNVKEADLNRVEKELEQIETGYVLDENLSLRKRIKLCRKIAKHKRALKRLEKLWRAAEPGELAPTENKPAAVQSADTGNVAAAPRTTTAATMGDITPAKKPKKKAVTPVVVVEQLPGQMGIEGAGRK